MRWSRKGSPTWPTVRSGMSAARRKARGISAPSHVPRLSNLWQRAPRTCMADRTLSVDCCVVGGGPAGMMLGFLLARAGVKVVVLEKHADFLRDFRGDTIHPSTLELMHELGILEEFLKRPHNQVREIKAMIGDTEITVADFTHLPTFCKFIAFMPQWDFLNFIVKQAKHFLQFQLRMES